MPADVSVRLRKECRVRPATIVMVFAGLLVVLSACVAEPRVKIYALPMPDDLTILQCAFVAGEAGVEGCHCAECRGVEEGHCLTCTP